MLDEGKRKSKGGNKRGEEKKMDEKGDERRKK